MTSKEFTSVWAREPRQSKAPGLSRDQIVMAAVELLDTEGLDALSMRKLGTKLGSGATSIYWHVANKHELLELAYDEVWGGMVVPDHAVVGWRETVSACAHSMRRVILAHPWASGLIGRMPAIGPNAMSVSTQSRIAYKAAGFRGLEIDFAAAAVNAYVFGMTIPEVAWNEASGGEGVDLDSLKEVVERAVCDYPEIRDQINEYAGVDQTALRETSFEFGLVSVLDGLERRLVT